MKKYIGGFLELELFSRSGQGYHDGALALSNARACISHIIRQTRMKQVWLPYYTCNALLEPFVQTGVPYRFYSLTEELEIADAPKQLGADEFLLYINYFGLKRTYVHEIVSAYGNQLLIDNTQDFFAHGYAQGWAFNSARKSFGVPDGGYLYGPVEQLGTADRYPVNNTYHAGYLIDRLRGAQQEAYEGFIAYEHTLTSESLRISELSASLLSQVDYNAVIAQRRENFNYYHNKLSKFNNASMNLILAALPAGTAPFCYPLMQSEGELLDRRLLFESNVFVPTLWQDVLTRQAVGFEWERYLTRSLLPLPVDHRYGTDELDKVIFSIQAHLKA